MGVVDDGVADFVAQNGFADIFAVFLRVELGRVDADDDDLVGVLLFQLGQVGQRVNAVDAAERPEVEDDDLAAQVFELDGAGGVEPAAAAVQFGGRMEVLLSGRRFVVRRRSGRRLRHVITVGGHENKQAGKDRNEEKGGKEPKVTPAARRADGGGWGRSLGHQQPPSQKQGRRTVTWGESLRSHIVFHGRQT